MTKPAGSIAHQAFEDALGVLVRQPALPAGLRPPFDYVVPAASTSRLATQASGLAGGPVHQAAMLLQVGATTSRDLVDEALAAAATNAELNGIAELDADGARLAAAEADAALASGRWRGPLHGIPITVKDVIDVAGLATRCGSLAYDVVPTADAVGVARLRTAGAIVLGKATTHEFALGVTSPQSRNPYDPTRIPGGSSGGSAVCVATGIGLASLGTDTRASIRVPAALSGTVGFKPTYGRIPTTGVVSLSWTMDHVAPMAASVADAALLLDVLLGGETALSRIGPAVTARIGLPPAAFAGAQPSVGTLVEDALGALDKAGFVLGEVARPDADDLELANAGGLVVSRCEAAAFHRTLALDRDLYWEEVAEQLAEAASITAMDYLDAQRARARLAADLLSCFDGVDVLAMPTVPVVAPPVDDFSSYLMLLSRNAIPWSFVGFPAISVPCGLADGLPVGLQLVAAPDREDVLVAVGRAVEEALGPPA